MDNKDQLALFLRDQVAVSNKKLRTTWIVGSIVVLLVVGYMSILLWIVRGFLDPWVAARTIASGVEKNMPILLNSMENSLAQKAPDIAEGISQKAVASLPVIRQQAEKQIASVAEDVLPSVGLKMGDLIREHIQGHRQEIAEFVKTHKDAEVAKYFLDTISSDAVSSLDDILQDQEPGKGVNYLQAAVVNGLSETKGKILDLSQKKPSDLSHVELLQRKLLASLIHAIQDAKHQIETAAAATK